MLAGGKLSVGERKSGADRRSVDRVRPNGNQALAK